jgi:hypothetical protein
MVKERSGSLTGSEFLIIRFGFKTVWLSNGRVQAGVIISHSS